MKQAFYFLIAGTLFGAGLTVSGMLNPAKTQNFLDFASISTGQWDPSLLITFLTALIITSVGYAISKNMKRPLSEEQFSIPTNRTIDSKLLFGPALYGIGWGLIGLCPGPDIASLVFGTPASLIFIVTFVIGIMLTWPLKEFKWPLNNLLSPLNKTPA